MENQPVVIETEEKGFSTGLESLDNFDKMTDEQANDEIKRITESMKS